MADIINLNRARKQKKRKQSEEQAKENRAKFGRTKAQKKKDASDASNNTKLFDGHKIDRSIEDEKI